MGKTLFQKEIAEKRRKEGIITETPQGQLPSPKHRTQVNILQGCKEFSEDVCNLLSSGNVLQAQIPF